MRRLLVPDVSPRIHRDGLASAPAEKLITGFFEYSRDLKTVFEIVDKCMPFLKNEGVQKMPCRTQREKEHTSNINQHITVEETWNSRYIQLITTVI